MSPVEGSPQVLALRDLAEARAALAHLRVSGAGIDIMDKKALFRVVRVRGLDVRAANILKQEMLSRGERWRRRAKCTNYTGTAPTASSWERSPSSSGSCQSSSSSLSDCAAWREPSRRLFVTTTSGSRPGRPDWTWPALRSSWGSSTSLPTRSPMAAATRAPVRRCGRRSTMAEEGAALIDIGGESTRPGSDPVPEEEETARVLPVVKALASSLPGRISVDTYKARVAARALAAGAYMINDISALRMDPEMVAVVRDAECPVILMHMLGEPKTMQVAPVYGDVVEESVRLLRRAARVGGGPTASRRRTCSSTPAWVSARRRSTTWRSCGSWRRSGRWAGRSWWGPRANGSWERYSASTRPSERDDAHRRDDGHGGRVPGPIW